MSGWHPDWVCPVCNVLIHGRNAACKKCKTPRLKPGDWVCKRDRCSEFNFRSNVKCRACKQPKPAVCVCVEPRFTSILLNGNGQPGLGYCNACLLPNPTPYWIPFINKLEVEPAANAIPREHWRYLIHGTKNLSGLGERLPQHRDSWYYSTREEVNAEMEARESRYISWPSIHIIDARGIQE